MSARMRTARSVATAFAALFVSTIAVSAAVAPATSAIIAPVA